MADEERPTNGDGFDDWLEEEPGPDTDPYAALAADDDAEAEISEWMAFTEGTSESPATPDAASGSSDDGATDEPGPDAPEESSAGATQEDAPVDDEPVDDEPTEELVIPGPVGAPSEAVVPATSVDLADFDGGGRPDTEEIPIITGSPEVEDAASADATPADDGDAVADGPGPAGDAPADAMERHEVDDTGEMPVVPADTAPPRDGDTDALAPETVAPGARDGEDAPAALDADDDTGELDPVPDAVASGTAAAAVFDLDEADTGEHPSQPFDISQDDYLATATREHAGLAAAIAEAETSETEQVALTAPIPGLETTVVGFEDVVEAEGHTKARARASGDLLARVVTGVALIAAVGVSLFYRPALVALATVVFVIGAGEFYTALRRSGRQPIALFGFLGILGASVGGFVWGAIAIPTSFLLVAALLLLFYAVVPGKPEPMANLALTVTVMVWAGLGSYAMMIIDSDDFRPLVIGVVLTVALMDIAQYFVGRSLGRHQLSPWVSPKKTVEGLVGGVIVALTLGALLHFVPPFELTSGLAVGAAVAVLSPLGDLAMSAAKRALGIKDMGSILPGHGGFLDRIDGLLFVIPAVWAIFLWAGLI